MAHAVVFTHRARDDLISLYRFIAARSGHERGARRDDLMPGLRVVGFGRWTSIAFHVDAQLVVFDCIYYGGRNLDDFLKGR